VKGLYARARRGQITGFTGVDDPYEPPIDPEITLDTVNHTAEENARLIVQYLEEQGFLLPDGTNRKETILMGSDDGREPSTRS
jgi:adenylylsulfate kinase-like enzyme